MGNFEPMRTAVYSIGSFLKSEYEEFGFVIEEAVLFPSGKYLAVMVRLDDDSRFIHVFDTEGQVLPGWENGIPVPCADEAFIFPGAERLAVFTKCGSGKVVVYPVLSENPEKNSITVTFSKLPLYVNFTRGERLVIFGDYYIEYFSSGEIQVIKVPILPNGYVYIHDIVDSEDSVYLLYTRKEGNEQRLEVGKITLPQFPYYSPREFWDGIEIVSKTSTAPMGGKPVGSIYLDEGGEFAAAVMGTKGGKEVYVLTPKKNWVVLLPGELIYLSFVKGGLFLITGVFNGSITAGIVPLETLFEVRELRKGNLNNPFTLGRYVPGVVDPKYAGVSRDGSVLYFGRTSYRSSGNRFYYYLRRDVDYLYKIYPDERSEPAEEKTEESTRHIETVSGEDIEQIRVLLRRFKQVILYGPPGTGKTYLARKVASKPEFVSFHQSFSYEDFVEGFRPVKAKGSPVYDVVDGVFKRLAIRAIYDSLPPEFRGRDETYEGMKKAVQRFLKKKKEGESLKLTPRREFYLIIDEINRGNISRIFGELITLLDPDKRLGGANETIVTLPYSGELFAVPPNLYIIGTMNSADRSIALLDIALRRRFAFFEVLPKPEMLSGIEVEGINLEHLLSRLNMIIEREKGKDYTIGHGYFMDIPSSEDPGETLYLTFYHKILPLFQEYFYGNWEQLSSLYLGFEFIDDKGRIIRMDRRAFFESLRRLVKME